jgi:hypothetical protein
MALRSAMKRRRDHAYRKYPYLSCDVRRAVRGRCHSRRRTLHQSYPDSEHPNSGICIKGSAAPEIVYSPDRLRHPMKRTRPKSNPDPGWVEISWALPHRARDAHGRARAGRAAVAAHHDAGCDRARDRHRHRRGLCGVVVLERFRMPDHDGYPSNNGVSAVIAHPSKVKREFAEDSGSRDSLSMVRETVRQMAGKNLRQIVGKMTHPARHHLNFILHNQRLCGTTNF